MLEAKPAAPGVTVLSDIPYLEAGRAEKLDIYLPAQAQGDATLRPAVVYFHGGGWYKGDKATDREKDIGNAVASAGYVFVTANYLLGKPVWPTNLLDCKNAIRFLRAHAAEYHVDTGRIASMGTSAGGHLALLAAFTADEGELEPKAPYPGVSEKVRAVVDFYGITDLSTRHNVNEAGESLGTLDDAHSAEMLGVSRKDGAALWKLASPVSHITPQSPPVLVVHGLSDRLVDYTQAIELANVLRANHVPHQLILIEGIGHQFDLDTWEGKPMPIDLQGALLKFLESTLGKP